MGVFRGTAVGSYSGSCVFSVMERIVTFTMLSSAKSNKFYLFSWAIGALVMSTRTCRIRLQHGGMQDVAGKKQNKEKRLVGHLSMH